MIKIIFLSICEINLLYNFVNIIKSILLPNKSEFLYTMNDTILEPNYSKNHQIEYDFLLENKSESEFSSQQTDTIETLNVWNFNYGIFQKQRLSSVLGDIEEVLVEQCNLGSIQFLSQGTNENQKIPSIISHISFPCLKLLNLQTNHIKSIEIFQFLKVPSMKQLILSKQIHHLLKENNHISELRVFRKLKWENVEVIDLEKNLVTDLHPVTFSGFNKLRKLVLETDNDEKVCQNLSNVLKLSTSSLLHLICPSLRRIVIEERIMGQVKNKYSRRQVINDGNNNNIQDIIHQQHYVELQIIHHQRKKNY